MKSNKKYQCPFCSKKYTKIGLPEHLEDAHNDVLPADFTPLQYTYHIVNNKPLEYRRPCRVCGKPTYWDENKGRYNFLCGNPKCKDAWVKQMKDTMGDKYGKYRPTQTPEGLEKMLAGRKISGKYRWKDGVEFTYTGKYELETLKFMDKVLEVKSEDLQVPGPIMQYKLNDETHYYIPDMYYIPYNLIIEVKDGGSNPNTNQSYSLTRLKQMAKENHVINETDYNYIRLTDKDFSQLLAVFADLKMHLVENDKSRVIHVNENTAVAAIAPVVGFNSNDAVIVNYMKKNTFVDDNEYAVCDSPKFDTVFTRENGILVKTDKSVFEGCVYTPYIIRNGRHILEEAIINNLNNRVDKNFLYEAAFGHKSYSSDQIMFEDAAEPYEDYYQGLENVRESVNKFFEANIKNNKAIDPYDNTGLVERRWGVISKNDAYNCCVKIKGYPKPMRARSSMLILRKNNNKYEVLFKYNKDDDEFSAPGGGWNENEDPMDAAIREAKEEVRINVTNVEYCGNLIEYHTEVKDWVKDNVDDENDWWYGYFSEIFVGLYDSKFTGFVDEMDRDSMIKEAKWYPVKELLKNDSKLNKEYQSAILKYIISNGGDL